MKFINLIFALLFILNFIFVETNTEKENESLDTSDNNPIAYCLRQRNGFTEERIKQFLIDIQEPEKAVGLFPYGGRLSKCVQQRIKETKEN